MTEKSDKQRIADLEAEVRVLSRIQNRTHPEDLDVSEQMLRESRDAWNIAERRRHATICLHIEDRRTESRVPIVLKPKLNQSGWWRVCGAVIEELTIGPPVEAEIREAVFGTWTAQDRALLFEDGAIDRLPPEQRAIARQRQEALAHQAYRSGKQLRYEGGSKHMLKTYVGLDVDPEFKSLDKLAVILGEIRERRVTPGSEATIREIAWPDHLPAIAPPPRAVGSMVRPVPTDARPIPADRHDVELLERARMEDVAGSIPPGMRKPFAGMGEVG
jgi:hypothetical protein